MRFRGDAIIGGLLLASCASGPDRKPQFVASPAPQLRPELTDGPLRIGAAYTIAGKRYVPANPDRFEQTGLASWYGDELRGQRTANGEAFDPDGLSAAHPTLPMPSYIAVTSLDTGRSIIVRVNDRGPFHTNRIVDMSMGAARHLAMAGHGARPVQIARVYPSEADKMAVRQGISTGTSQVSGLTLKALRRAAGWTPPVQPTAVTAIGSGPFYLQIASFSSITRAESMAARLGAQISPVGTIYRVRLGPFGDAAQANAALAPLAAKGYPDVRITR
jgi:rare lipoprotein A